MRNRALELAQARRIDAILVTERSRWGRSAQDLLDTLYKLAGWKLSGIAMSGMTLALDTPHGPMMAMVLAGMAQFDRHLLSERAKSGLAAARKAAGFTWAERELVECGLASKVRGSRVDGRFDATFRTALRRWQASNAHTATGYLTRGQAQAAYSGDSDHPFRCERDRRLRAK